MKALPPCHLFCHVLQIIPQLLHEGCRDVSALKDWFATNPQLRGSFLLAVHGGSQAPMLCKAGLLLDSWELVCPQQVSVEVAC